MKTSTILKKAGVNPDEQVLLITAEEAMENLLEAIEEYCPDLDVNSIKAEDLKTLLDSYGECVIDYHPESYHQERVALLKNFEMLEKYGLTDEDYKSLDFV